MSFYYKQVFASAEPLYAEVRQSLRSYFESGIVDDMLFPTWTEQCLLKLGKGANHVIQNAVLNVQDHEACLPDDFISVREAWMCKTITSKEIQSPSALYYQTDCRLERVLGSCDNCFENVPCVASLTTCVDDEFRVTHKVTGHYIYNFKIEYLLQPGNINSRKHCANDCPNLYSSAPNSFDISDHKFITNFNDGTVYLIYYADAVSAEGDMLVPDNIRVQDYVRKFITYKLMEVVANMTTDETFNQSMQKMTYYKQQADEAYIIALTEMKKETVQDINRKIVKTRNRFRNYNIR